jgi:hypothetical protein
MGVDEEPDPAVGHLLDGRDELVGELRELGVNKQNAIGAGEDAGVADERWPHAFESVKIARELRRLDVDLAEIRRLSAARRLGADGRAGETCEGDREDERACRHLKGLHL